MAIVFKTCEIGEGTKVHFCDPCSNKESGGIRGAAYIENNYISRDADGKIDKTKVTTLEWWNTGIETGKIIVIPKTRGTFDGGAPNNVPGYGDFDEVVKDKTFTLVVNDPDHKQNDEFWDTMEKSVGQYHVAWRTGSELRISDNSVQTSVTDPVEEGVNTQVNWQATVTWNQDDKRTVPLFDLGDVKSLFECFEVTNEETPVQQG